MGEGFQGMLPFLLMFVVIIFFMVIPAQRRQKKEKNFINSLKKGDRVITKSGMHAKVLEVNDKDNSCVLETMAGKLKFDRSAISMEASSRLQTAVKK
ncbi:preprotein translocase subunit YajC [Sungkyunkwania multivorans]|uniref:Sec translocon accessory complex subunit YajC n=1 Tax=Sungkyunkwania multivorans TaxID=1173618 RepID=A0ABW3D2C9_9FLAO